MSCLYSRDSAPSPITALAIFIRVAARVICCWGGGRRRSPRPVICSLARTLRNVRRFVVTVDGNVPLGPIRLVALPLFGLVLSPLEVVRSPLDVVRSPLEVVRPPLECE